MTILLRIAERVLGRPLLIHPAKAELIASVLGDRIGIGGSFIERDELPAALTAPLTERPAANRLVGEPVMAGRTELYRRANGVGIIPIVGTLTNRGTSIGEDSSGFTSYESIAVQMRAALADPQVQSILLDMDSAGGEASGMFALADAVRTARATKPVSAVVDDMAASSAFGIAANATEVVVSPTSITGSIGVVLLHLDQSAELQMKGRRPTLIFAGAHKVDANPFGPLSPEVRADLQREVDTFYARFVDQVAAGRPRLTTDAVKATEARIFIGAEAIDAGLADRIGTFDDTLARLSSAIRARNLAGGPIMQTNDNPIARADHDTAVREARAQGEAAGRTTAIERVRAILNCPEAKGREAQAQVFALDTDMAPDVAAKALAAAPAAKATPALDVRGAAPLAAGAASAADDSKARWDRSLKRAGATMPAA
jgi:signal peptide peptidase SppA